MNQKGFTNIALIVTVIMVAGVAGYFALVKKQEPIVQQTIPPTTTQTPIPQQPSPTPINKTTSIVTIDTLARNPRSFLNKKIQITGKLILTGKNYFIDPSFAVREW